MGGTSWRADRGSAGRGLSALELPHGIVRTSTASITCGSSSSWSNGTSGMSNPSQVDLDWIPHLSAIEYGGIAGLSAAMLVLLRRLVPAKRGFVGLVVSTMMGMVSLATFLVCRYILIQRLYIQRQLRPEKLCERIGSADSRFETVNGISVHYKTTRQSGSPDFVLHCAHGFGASLQTWEAVRHVISSTCKALVVAHDTPGFGLTERPSRVEDFTLHRNAKISLQLMEKWGAGEGGTKVFLGHSMGCISASMAAVSYHKERASTRGGLALVLVAPAIMAKDKSRWAAGEAKATSFLAILADIFVRCFRLSRRLALRSALCVLHPILLVFVRALVRAPGFWKKALQQGWFNKELVDKATVDAYRLAKEVQGWDHGFVKFVRAQIQAAADHPGYTGELVAGLRELTEAGVPVLIIHGVHDALVPLSNSRRLVELVPGAELEVLSKCGHVPMEEVPAEFATVLSAFLKSDKMRSEEQQS